MAYIISNDNANGYSRADFISALAAKQDVLVSGENIKTINHQSLIGQGNVQIDISPQIYEYDLTDLEQTLHDDTITKLNAVNPIDPSTGKRKYVSFGFITDLHTMPTKTQIVADDDIENVVSDILAMGIELEQAENDQTISEQIRSTWPTSDASYYGASSEGSVKLLGSIAHDFGLDAVFCDGDLSSGRLPYNSYAYMLEIMARMVRKYISVPYFLADGNHDRQYSSDVAYRKAVEWKKFRDRFNTPRGLKVRYVCDNADACAFMGDEIPIGYSVDIDKGGENRLHVAVIPMYGSKQTVSMNYAISIDDTDKNANDWTLVTMSHTNVQYVATYYTASLAGRAHGKGNSSNQNQYPVMNMGNKLKACIGHIDGHIHQSLVDNAFGDNFHRITVSSAYADNTDAYKFNTDNGYCFSVFTVDTDNWWLYEHQVGRRPRVDSNYQEVEGNYEKVADGIYRYKIYLNPELL